MKINANDRYSYQGGIRGPLKNYAGSVLAIFVFTVFGYSLTPFLDLTNIALLYLLPVLVGAVRWGRGSRRVTSGMWRASRGSLGCRKT